MTTSFPTMEMDPMERAARAYRPEASWGDVLSVSVQDAFENTTLMSYGRNQILEEQGQVGPKLSPEEVIAKYPNFPGKPTEQLTELQAQTIQDRHDEKLQRQQILSNASGLWKGSVVPFLGSIVGSQMDPIDMTVGMVLGAGIGKAVQASKFATPVPKLTQVYLQELAGNMAANTVNEAFVMQANKAELQEYTASHAAKSMMLSSVFGAGLSTGIHAVGKALSKVGPQGHAQALETVRQAMEDGKSPGAVLQTIASKLEEDLKVTPEVKNAYAGFADEEVFGRLEDAEDMADVFSVLREELESGRVTPEEVQKFKDTIEAQGFDKRKYYLATQEEGAKLSDQAAQDIAQTLEDPKNDLHHDDKIEEAYNRQTDPAALIKEGDEMLEQDLARYKTLPEEELNAKLEQSRKFAPPEVVKAEQQFEVEKFLKGCLYGGDAA